MIWPFSLILASSSIGSERVGLLHAPTTIKYYNVFHRVTKSWNCWVWKELLEIICSHLPAQSRAGYHRLIWAKSNKVLNISRDGELITSVGHHVPLFGYPHRKKKKCILIFNWNLLYLICAHCPFTAATEKSPSPSLQHHLCSDFCKHWCFTWAISHLGWTVPDLCLS